MLVAQQNRATTARCRIREQSSSYVTSFLDIVPETKEDLARMVTAKYSSQDKIPKSKNCNLSHRTVSQKQITVLSYSFQ